jgi:clan AA aspartic protease
MQIDGYFNSVGEPAVRLDLGSSGIEVLIDTGFNGHLIISDQIAEGLDVKYDRGLEEFYSVTGEIILASGCSLEIHWLGERITVPVAMCSQIGEAILGGQMLKDCRLTIDYAHGAVSIAQSQ